MPNTSPGYSITVRVEAPAVAHATAALTTAVSSAGGALTALDVVESHADRIVVDVTCDATDVDHADRITEAIAQLPGVTVRKVSDRTFLLHLGGKIEVTPKVPLKHRDDLSRAYTPGVARVCLAIAENPEDARRLTIKRNTVAVVTDGSAVLGLGNIGPAAALPVMEGKAALFKRFAGVDAWPVCLDTQDTDEIVEIVQGHRPRLRRDQPGGHRGAALLRDRGPAARAARHPGVPRRPARHRDRRARRADQRAAGRRQASCRTSGSSCPGSAPPGTPSSGCCTPRAPADIIGCDRARRRPRAGRPSCDRVPRRGSPTHTNPDRRQGTLKEVLAGADVFIGVSAPNLLTGDDIATMADGAIVFALANPDPEVDPVAASEHAAVVATGRSDYPNQINNVLAFPGFFRGLLDARRLTTSPTRC